MIAPAAYSFDIYQGATFSKTMQLLDANDDPLVTTGWTARCQAREGKEAEQATITFGTTSGTTISINSTGLITVTATAAATAGLKAQTLVYDIEVVDGATVHRVLEGEIRISREVTR
jgi:hypothetical protein